MQNRRGAGRFAPPCRALAWWVIVGSGCSPPTEAPASSTSVAAPGRSVVDPPADGALAAEEARAKAADAGAPEARRRAAERRLALAEELLCSYQDASKYPFTARPIAEHPDQVHPNRPIAERRIPRRPDGTRDTSLRIHTSQSRIFLAAGESVVFTIAATNLDGVPRSLRVARAEIRGLPAQPGAVGPQRRLVLTDDGQHGDAVAGDGTLSGTWSGTAEFAKFAGTLRAEVEYAVAEHAGIVWFDAFYSPEVPARWSGPIREAVEDGDLAFYLPVTVQAPGRYLVSARVDDVHGEPLALLTFNDPIGAGEQEIRLALHGKLLRDLAPRFPLRLRDIDAFLLREDTDPDRALIPRVEGEAHVTRRHRLTDFSAEEWQSDERARYLAEFGRDVEQARAELADLDPGRLPVAFTPDQCRRFNANVGVPQS